MGIENFKCEFALSLTKLLNKHCKSKDTYNEMKQCINEARSILIFIQRDIDEDIEESCIKQEQSIEIKVDKGLCPSTVFDDECYILAETEIDIKN
jgi:hypothetical protein